MKTLAFTLLLTGCTLSLSDADSDFDIAGELRADEHGCVMRLTRTERGTKGGKQATVEPK